MANLRTQQSDFFEAPSDPAHDRLLRWAPFDWSVAPDWQPVTQRFFESEPAHALGRFIEARLAAGATIYPPQPLRALDLTPLDQVRVVILGQDPYHGPGQAEGLAFSVAPGTQVPPSLRNIFKELARARQARAEAAWPVPTHGSLVHWARQGVLLLNTCLTVEAGQPASHAKKGWEALTSEIVSTVLRRGQPVVFMLWGGPAQRAEALIQQHGHVVRRPEDEGCHYVLCANHPSPLSALRPPVPFLGCDHFELANEFLRQRGCAPIVW